MELNLAGKAVAVIGAAKGIGRAIAIAFQDEGCQVVGFDCDSGPSAIEMTIGDVTSFEQVLAFAAAHSEVEHIVFSVGAGSASVFSRDCGIRRDRSRAALIWLGAEGMVLPINCFAYTFAGL